MLSLQAVTTLLLVAVRARTGQHEIPGSILKQPSLQMRIALVQFAYVLRSPWWLWGGPQQDTAQGWVDLLSPDHQARDLIC